MPLDPADDPRDPPSRSLPYARSTLSPVITPTDLSSFKSRGATKVEQQFRLQLEELKAQYDAALDTFLWNKLVYESRFSFEPQIGGVYHLYQSRHSGLLELSMIAPEEWPSRRWVGTFRLNTEARWEPVATDPAFTPEP